MSRRLGPAQQVGHVVADVQAAIESFVEGLGIGPFFTLPDYRIRGFELDGQRSEPRVSVAVAYSGPIQIELIQPLDDTPSLYRELLLQGHPGPHYLTYWVRDLDAQLQAALSRGHSLVQSGGEPGRGRFRYLRHGDSGRLIELLETTDAIEARFAHMREAAATWDGRDPVRSGHLEKQP